MPNTIGLTHALAIIAIMTVPVLVLAFVGGQQLRKLRAELAKVTRVRDEDFNDLSVANARILTRLRAVEIEADAATKLAHHLAADLNTLRSETNDRLGVLGLRLDHLEKETERDAYAYAELADSVTVVSDALAQMTAATACGSKAHFDEPPVATIY